MSVHIAISESMVPIYPQDTVQAKVVSQQTFYASRFKYIEHPLREYCCIGVIYFSAASSSATFVALAGRVLFCTPCRAPAAIPAWLKWTNLTHSVAHLLFCSSPLVLTACLIVSAALCIVSIIFIYDRTLPTYLDYLRGSFQGHLSKNELVAAGQVLEGINAASRGHTSMSLALAEKYFQRNNPTALRQALDHIPFLELMEGIPLLDEIARKFQRIEEQEMKKLQKIVQLIPIAQAVQNLVLEYLDPKTSVVTLIRLPATLKGDWAWQEKFSIAIRFQSERSAAYYSTQEHRLANWVPREYLSQEPSRMLRAACLIAAEREWRQRKTQLEIAESYHSS